LIILRPFINHWEMIVASLPGHVNATGLAGLILDESRALGINEEFMP